jgi:hydroxypyruvate isomerase
MKLSVSIPCFYPGLDFCEAIRRAHALGVDAVETWDWKPLDLDHPDTYLWSSAEAFELLREAEALHAKILFDRYHMQAMEGNLVPTMLANLPAIGHLHAAGHPGRHDLQDGETNYPAVFRALDAAGFEGRCGLEYFPRGEPEESLRATLRMLKG